VKRRKNKRGFSPASPPLLQLAAGRVPHQPDLRLRHPEPVRGGLRARPLHPASFELFSDLRSGLRLRRPHLRQRLPTPDRAHPEGSRRRLRDQRRRQLRADDLRRRASLRASLSGRNLPDAGWRRLPPWYDAEPVPPDNPACVTIDAACGSTLTCTCFSKEPCTIGSCVDSAIQGRDISCRSA